MANIADLQSPLISLSSSQFLFPWRLCPSVPCLPLNYYSSHSWRRLKSVFGQRPMGGSQLLFEIDGKVLSSLMGKSQLLEDAVAVIKDSVDDDALAVVHDSMVGDADGGSPFSFCSAIGDGGLEDLVVEDSMDGEVPMEEANADDREVERLRDEGRRFGEVRFPPAKIFYLNKLPDDEVTSGVVPDPGEGQSSTTNRFDLNKFLEDDMEDDSMEESRRSSFEVC